MFCLVDQRWVLKQIISGVPFLIGKFNLKPAVYSFQNTFLLSLLSNDQMFSLKKGEPGLGFKSLVRLLFVLLHQTLLKVPLCSTKLIDKTSTGLILTKNILLKIYSIFCTKNQTSQQLSQTFFPWKRHISATKNMLEI